jgi:hypothetical protein
MVALSAIKSTIALPIELITSEIADSGGKTVLSVPT